MSLLITVEKLYFMDGIYRVTAQTEKTVNPDVNAYITHMTIEVIRATRGRITRSLLLNMACRIIAREYRLATSGRLDYHRWYEYDIVDVTSYPDYREAIEGVEGVYLTD